jgi:Flp pilus assembly protein TadG
MRQLAKYLKHTGAAGAVEFALVLPGVLFLLFGSINVFTGIYSWITLTSSCEQAARYAAIQYTVNGIQPTSATIQTYAKAAYVGPVANQTYVYTITGVCGTGGANGENVSATGNFPVYYGFGSVNFPVNSKACFPFA